MTPKPDQVHQDALMARRKKKEKSRRQELLEELIAEAGPEALKDPEGLLKELTRSLVNTAMEAELSHHLGYEPGERPPAEEANRRNGKSEKTVRTGHGSVPIEVPRDRDGSFEPKLIPKHSRQFAGFDDKILSMYARGMTVREIRGHLEEIYGVEVSPDLISRVTDAVVDELTAWQSRPLERVYLVAYLDALVIKVRDKSGCATRACTSWWACSPTAARTCSGCGSKRPRAPSSGSPSSVSFGSAGCKTSWSYAPTASRPR